MKIEITKKQVLGVLVIVALALVAGFAVGNRGVINFASPFREWGPEGQSCSGGAGTNYHYNVNCRT